MELNFVVQKVVEEGPSSVEQMVSGEVMVMNAVQIRKAPVP